MYIIYIYIYIYIYIIYIYIYIYSYIIYIYIYIYIYIRRRGSCRSLSPAPLRRRRPRGRASDGLTTSNCFLLLSCLFSLVSVGIAVIILPAWRAAQVGAGVPVSLERQPTTKAPKTNSCLAASSGIRPGETACSPCAGYASRMGFLEAMSNPHTEGTGIEEMRALWSP